MDPERDRIQDDLRGLVHGEVRCDDVFLQLYASDASLYEIRPLGVVRPQHTADVSAVVQYAAEKGIPLHARGAGTGLAGEAVGPGLIVDFSYAMRRIVQTGSDTVRVQPGVVHAHLNRHLAQFGRTFGPDPANSSVTTMGSVLALDNTGSHWLKHGSPRRHVESMQVVLSTGEVLELGCHAVQDANDPVPKRRELVGRVVDLINRETATIAAHTPKSPVNRSGYRLHDVLQNGQVDLAKLLVGSEGTLALITEATVRTEPLSPHRAAALLFFDRLDAAARAALEVPRMGASACDLMDRRLLSMARESDSLFESLIPPAAEAMLLVQFEGADVQAVRERVQTLVGHLRQCQPPPMESRIALEHEEIALYWRLTRHVVHYLYRLKGSTRPLPFVEDVAVPPEVLPDFLITLQNILKKHQVTASLFAHAGHGQLHVRPFLDLAQPDHVRTMLSLAEDLYGAALEVGGTISGEHGDGLSRTWYLRRMFGPLYDVFREVKRIFDPRNILNPGKVVADLPQPLTKNLRPYLGPEPAPAAVSSTNRAGSAFSPPGSESASVLSPVVAPRLIDLNLNWSTVDMAATVNTCNSCGACRTQSPDQRMCPLFRYRPGEENSPRAKASVLRGVLSGRLNADELTKDRLKEVADACVHCHQCRLECPANVDIPRLMLEAKSQYVATNGLSMSDWFFSRLDYFAAWGVALHPVANWALQNRQFRWLLEKLTGVAQGRKLPRLASQTFLRKAQRRRLTRPSRGGGRKVALFFDVYANWFDVQLAEAFVAVLEHNGVSVFVHAKQLPAGMPLIAAGGVERARKLAKKNVSVLADAVRQGYHVVCTEPSAAICLTHEYPQLLDDDDAQLVAQNTSEACSYLWKLHLAGQLELDLRPVNATVGYHLPCHLKALGQGSPGENLLRLIPGLTVKRVERGCSGMAGTFGLKRESFRASLRAGWGLISSMRDISIQVGATECSTCKLQMEQGTKKPTLHPLKLLALGYGLMPEIAQQLASRSEELVVS